MNDGLRNSKESVMHKRPHVLMIVTSHDRIDAQHATGLWLEEFALPFEAFRSQGYSITVASPRGGAAPIDPRSEPAAGAAPTWDAARAALQHTVPLATLNAADYDAVFLPGGHGTMFDLPDNADLAALLRDVAAADKVIAAVCHGPAGLVSATRADGTPLVAGKTITAFTNEEERAAGLDQQMPFLLETRLRELGGRVITQPNWSDHVEQDGTLITGQNPQSSASVAQAVIQTLTPTTYETRTA
jgi:putative intracellular protease/amidase